MSSRRLATITALVLALAPSAAAAKRVALVELRGPELGSVRAALTHALRAEHVVVPHGETAMRLIELGMKPRCRPGEITAIAAAVRVDAILCGEVSGPRRARVLALRVYNGGDGKLLTRTRLRLRGLGQLGTVLAPALASAWSFEVVEVNRGPGKRAGLRDLRAAATVTEAPVWEDSDGENPLLGRSRRRSAATRASVATAVRARPSATSRRPFDEHALQLAVGPSMLLRRNYQVYDPASPADGQGWVSNPGAGFVLAAEVYPGAFFTQGWGAKLGLGLSYARTFGLVWKQSPDPVEHSATHQVLTVDARARIALWRSERAPSLLLKLGYRYLGFGMNETPGVAAPIPDVSFSSLDLGVGAQIAILPRWLHVTASFDYLPVLGRGEIATPDEYGSAAGGGMVFAGGVRGAIFGPVGWRFDVEYAWYTISFDGDPTARRKADKARDRYVSGQLCLTYSL
jgi:hypothetical protein